MIKSWILIVFLICLILAAGLTASVFLSLSFYSRYLELTKDFQAQSQTIHSPSYLWYGLVEEVNPEENSLTVVLDDRHRPGEQEVRIRVYPSENALIARQELVASGGVYTGITPLSPARLSEIRPGTQVSLSTPENYARQDKLVVRTIIFGNPL